MYMEQHPLWGIFLIKMPSMISFGTALGEIENLENLDLMPQYSPR